jgi:hypothetical protein
VNRLRVFDRLRVCDLVDSHWSKPKQLRGGISTSWSSFSIRRVSIHSGSGTSFGAPWKKRGVTVMTISLRRAVGEDRRPLRRGPGHLAGHQLRVFGPAGALAVVLIDTQPGFSMYRVSKGRLVGSGGHPVRHPLATVGQDAAVVIPFQLPASLAGLEGFDVLAQAVFPGVPGILDPAEARFTNVAALIVRF